VAESSIQIAGIGSDRWVKLTGPATLHISPVFKRCLQNFRDERVSIIHLDLSECDWIDSTIAGCLVGFIRGEESHHTPLLVLYSPSEGCGSSLRQLGLDKYLSIKYSPMPASINWQECSIEKPSREELADVIMLAHEDLACGDPENEQFTKVAEALREDREKHRHDN